MARCDAKSPGRWWVGRSVLVLLIVLTRVSGFCAALVTTTTAAPPRRHRRSMRPRRSARPRRRTRRRACDAAL
ncbi:hypothetical protein M885DRAFT_534084, partial [Pelagophyceae sp. CCMP2097]